MKRPIEWPTLPAGSVAQKTIASFYEHLGTCRRCDNNPFDLCSIGARLIVEAAIAAGLYPSAPDSPGGTR